MDRKEEEIRHFRHEQARKRPCCVPTVQDRNADGHTLKAHKEALRWLFKLPKRVQGLIAPNAEGNDVCNQGNLQGVPLANHPIEVFHEAEMEPSVRQLFMPHKNGQILRSV